MKIKKTEPFVRIFPPINVILEGDCVESLNTLPEACADVVFADPPYNLQLRGELLRPNQTKVDAVNDEWDKFASFEAYDSFSEAWLRACYRVLKPNGTLWVIGTYHNIFRIGALMQNIGYWLLNDIVWIKSNPMPNFKGTRFNNAHETLIWAAKSEDADFTFHYKGLKGFNDDLQMRSDWYLPICGGGERLKIDGRKAHATQKPEALLYRVLLATTNPGDLVVDPFFGSGTTGAVAKRLGRNFIGMEREPMYIAVARERISAITPLPDEYFDYPVEVKKPRVSFGSLIEVAFLTAGEPLFSKDKRYCAYIYSDGSLLWNKNVGSIHKISATILNRPSNNGWEFWYVERENSLISINELRDKYIKQFILKQG